MVLFALADRKPTVPEGFHWIADCARIIGDVTISEDVGIWFGCVLRGDNEPIVVGPRSNIQEHVVMHTDPGYPLTVGEGCTVGHKAMLHGCTIGDNTLVGMNATVLNGAKIGKNCIIGAGALVKENEIVPDNTLVVGIPARSVKTLSSAAEKMLRMSADHYVENAKRFSASLKRI
jgi:carbonic anhydrase/acetyltransferase-like protein (isoleucine patch superfamily)